MIAVHCSFARWLLALTVAVPPAAAEIPAKPRIRLDVLGNRPAALYLLVAPRNKLASADLQLVCTAPCNRIVDGTSGRVFVVVAAEPPTRIGARSDMFELRQRGAVTLRVSAGSRARRIAGAIFLGLSGGFAVAGLLMVQSRRTMNVGLGLVAAYPVALGIGLPLMLTGQTRVHVVRTE